MFVVIGYADRAPIIDFGGADPRESDERRHGKERRGEKYNAVRKGGGGRPKPRWPHIRNKE